MYTEENARNTGSLIARFGMTNRTPVREGLVALRWRRGS
jgi:hypothetical protein